MNAFRTARQCLVMASLGLTMACILPGAIGKARADNVVVCVANDVQLRNALLSAYLVPTTIKLVQGTYELGGSVWDNASVPGITADGTKLLGGYTANCAGRDIQRGNTVLNDASGFFGHPVVFIHGNLTVEGLTWHTGLDIEANNIGDEDFGPPPGTIDLPPNTEVLIRRNAFIGAAFTVDWGQDTDIGGTIRIVDSLFVDAGVDSCTIDMEAIAGGEPVMVLINNTVYGIVCAYNHYSDGWGFGILAVDAYNNVFHNVNPPDIFTQTDAFFLTNNMLNHYVGPGPISETGTLTGDPQLDANYRPIEVPPSPVINSGSNQVRGGLPSSDLDGGPRVTGSTVDRGAYESNISDELLLQVTNNNDAGTGSLRAAIQSANTNGAGIITFDIGSGCGPHVITLASELPALTAGSIINGYSQTGVAANDLDVGDDATLCVILEAGNAGVTRALRVPASASDADAVSIKGLAFSGFSAAAIDLQGGSGHFVAGNHFGGSVGGHALQPNGVDIRIDAHDATIGGDDVANRNIIGGATGSGIVLQAHARDNQIVNNYIGVGWSASNNSYTDLGNGTRGVHILGPANTLSGNLIGDNAQAGLLIEGLEALANLIDGNFIGADAAGVALGNGSAGIHIAGSDADTPFNNTIRYNTIAHNDTEGVWAEMGFYNKIRKNAIYANGGLGIDLATEGVTANDDDGQTSDLANRGQNFPDLAGAIGGLHEGRVSGTLTTVPGDYTVDLYANASCDASGHGEGQVWLRGATVTVPAAQGGDQGTASFTLTVASPPEFPLAGRKLTATATDANGDTSEFSSCVAYVDDTIFADGFDPGPI